MNFKVFRIKEDKLKQWKQWCDILNARKVEVLETLKEEKVIRESCTLYDNNFFIYNGRGLSSVNRK